MSSRLKARCPGTAHISRREGASYARKRRSPVATSSWARSASGGSCRLSRPENLASRSREKVQGGGGGPDDARVRLGEEGEPCASSNLAGWFPDDHFTIEAKGRFRPRRALRFSADSPRSSGTYATRRPTDDCCFRRCWAGPRRSVVLAGVRRHRGEPSCPRRTCRSTRSRPGPRTRPLRPRA